MTRRTVRAAVALVALLGALASGCGGPDGPGDEPADGPADGAGDDRGARLERMAREDPAVLLGRIRRATGATVIRASITREEETTSTFVAGPDAWRAERPTADPTHGPTGGLGDGRATLLAVGDRLCFDREVRPQLAAGLAESYGMVEFDPQPWTCTPSDFGLNALLTLDARRTDPRWRLDHLGTDAAAFSAAVERVDGEPLLHLRTTGVTPDGPLDPARPAYDLWVDADHLPVRMETAGITWELEHGPGADDELAVPPASQRGSYGYRVGPGQGVAKACRQSGSCPAAPPAASALTWGDGRRS